MLYVNRAKEHLGLATELKITDYMDPVLLLSPAESHRQFNNKVFLLIVVFTII